MSTSAAQASAFFAEVIRNQQVFTVADDGGVPAPKNRHGVRAMPFWSLKSRAQKVVDTVPAYRASRSNRSASWTSATPGCPIWRATGFWSA
ncbi:MAG: DUF2750 domain-containing protein [Propionibacteriaceae bacterium]|jgi:hypothetical protein|nr:DUF2750 domain-containing protein [Propionibacteriaceae bacterium]